MLGTEHNCSVRLLLCKTALQQDCTAAFTPMPFTQRRVESAPAHSKHAWDRKQLLCHAAAVQNSPTARLHCCIYTYADCLSHTGASSQHQPTATMPERDYICCAMLLLCKTALQQNCTAAFTPMPFTQRRVESTPAHSKHAWDIILALFDSATPGALLSYQDRLLGSCKGHSSSTYLVVSRSQALGQ